MHRDLAEAILRSPRSQQVLLEVLRELPGDVDVELATLRVMQVLSPSTPFIEAARRFPARVVARVLAHIPVAAERDAQAVFLAEAARAEPGELLAAWGQALEAFAALGAYEALAPKKRRSRARVLVKDASFLQAVQAAVAGAENETSSMIELLAADGSEASVDALLVAVARAETAGGFRLRQVMRILQLGARTPRMEEMVEALVRRHGEP